MTRCSYIEENAPSSAGMGTFTGDMLHARVDGDKPLRGITPDS
jgi:hypothetical protein